MIDKETFYRMVMYDHITYNEDDVGYGFWKDNKMEASVYIEPLGLQYYMPPEPPELLKQIHIRSHPNCEMVRMMEGVKINALNVIGYLTITIPHLYIYDYKRGYKTWMFNSDTPKLTYLPLVTDGYPLVLAEGCRIGYMEFDVMNGFRIGPHHVFDDNTCISDQIEKWGYAFQVVL